MVVKIKLFCQAGILCREPPESNDGSYKLIQGVKSSVFILFDSTRKDKGVATML